MAKSAPGLDTPFRRGEQVVTTRDLPSISQGAEGKVRLANGLGEWRRYWVRFNDGTIRGQVSHNDLARPGQVEEWVERQEQARLTAERGEAEAAAPAAPAEGASDGAGGIAAQIPAHLLERSRAAKARLLGS